MMMEVTIMIMVLVAVVMVLLAMMAVVVIMMLVMVVVVAFQSFSYKHPRESTNVGSLYISNTGTLCSRERRMVPPLLAASTQFLAINWNVSLSTRNLGKQYIM